MHLMTPHSKKWDGVNLRRTPNCKRAYVCMFSQVPWSRDGLMQLMEKVQSCSLEGATKGTAPVVVHCVDGASQSGLFCACWIICEKLSVDGQVDIFHTVKALKLKRYHFVNTLVRS